QPRTQPHTLWKRRALEKPQSRLFHRAWKSRKVRGIPPFPQRPRLLYEKTQESNPDISLATKSGHFDWLRTHKRSPGRESWGRCSREERVSSGTAQILAAHGGGTSEACALSALLPILGLWLRPC